MATRPRKTIEGWICMQGALHVREELANSLTHGFGLLLSVTGLPVLIWLAVRQGTWWHIVSCSIYGCTLVLLYAASTLYHSVRTPALKRVFKIFDHCAIFLLIAGTYTPFTLVSLRAAGGWKLFGIIWGMAVLGIAVKAVAIHRFRIASPIFYLLMGWIAVVAIKPMILLIGWQGLIWIACGGLAYTIGVIFFAWEKLPYNHAVWHVCVLLGSVCHYVGVVRAVLMPR